VQLSADLKKMEALHANYKRNRHSLESRAEWLSQGDDRAERVLADYRKDAALRDTNTFDEWKMKVGTNVFDADSKDHLMESVLSGMQRAIEGRAKHLGDKAQVVHIGEFRGFKVTATADARHVQFALKGSRVYVPGNLVYSREDKFSVTGFIQRMDNALNGIESDIAYTIENNQAERIELEKVRQELTKPFAQLAELELLRKNNADVMTELRKMQDDPAYVSAWEPATLESMGGRDGDLFSSVDPDMTERATREQARTSEVRESIDRAASDYLRGAREPLRTADIFNRGHESLFEWEGGREVHSGLVERIKSDARLALAVATAPGKRFASEEMLDAAESVLLFKSAAKAQAAAVGLEAEFPRRNEGVYRGTVVAETDQYVVQNVGMNTGVLHHRSDLVTAQPVKVGDDVRFAYRAGHAIVRFNERGTGHER
jgi:hypothetical protein